MPIFNTEAQQTAKLNSESQPRIQRTIPPSVSTYQLDKNKNRLEDMYQLQLRVATIQNPMRSINSPISQDPLETSGVINLNTGNCVLRFNDLGGVGAGSLNASGQQANGPISYAPCDRTLNEMSDDDNTSTVPLTYPFIFTNAKNWCGINYMPPVNSKVIIGFGKSHFPFILGYLTENYKILTPPLMPGEVCIKGWGNNYIHWQWSNKIEIVAGANQGTQDLDDSSGGKSSTADARARISVDGDNGSISLTVNGSGILINDSGVFLQSNGSSSLSITEDSARLQVKGNSSLSLQENGIGVATSGGVDVNSSTYGNNAANIGGNSTVPA